MKMRIEKDRAIVSLDPEEVIVKPYYMQSDPAERPTYAGESIGDAIRRAAWRDLTRLAGEHIEGRSFAYGSVDVVDGKVVVTFFQQLPKLPAPPGPP